MEAIRGVPSVRGVLGTLTLSEVLPDVALTYQFFPESRVRMEQTFLEKLNAVKSGLMTDLLTGRVRVPAEVAVAL